MTWHAAWRGIHAPKPKTRFLTKRVWGKAVNVFYMINKSCNDILKNSWYAIYNNTNLRTLYVDYLAQAGHCISLGRKSASALSNKHVHVNIKSYTFFEVSDISEISSMMSLDRWSEFKTTASINKWKYRVLIFTTIVPVDNIWMCSHSQVTAPYICLHGTCTQKFDIHHHHSEIKKGRYYVHLISIGCTLISCNTKKQLNST